MYWPGSSVHGGMWHIVVCHVLV